MTLQTFAVIVTVLLGALANFGTLVSFRVKLEHRLTRLETLINPKTDP